MIFDQATWRGPIPNESPGRMVHPVYGLVLHIEQGSEAGTDNWFHNPGAQASAHFGNPKTGPLDQWVDTGDKAWAEVDGNANWISVEHEGNSGDSLTPSQIENDAQLLAWLHTTDGVALQLTDDPYGRGLGFHAMGGDAWGGHYQCPGQPIIDQRQAIVARAIEIIGGTPDPPKPPDPPKENDMAISNITVDPGQEVSITLPATGTRFGTSMVSITLTAGPDGADCRAVLGPTWGGFDPDHPEDLHLNPGERRWVDTDGTQTVLQLTNKSTTQSIGVLVEAK